MEIECIWVYDGDILIDYFSANVIEEKSIECEVYVNTFSHYIEISKLFFRHVFMCENICK